MSMACKTLIFITGFFVIVSSLSSCSNEKRLAVGKPLRSMDAVSILNKIDKAALDWDWIGMKVDTDVNFSDESESFTLSIRMQRDSAIWISLSPALGVEIARLLLLPDSVKLISKVPSNKFVFEGDYSQLEDLISVPFDFYIFQDLFSGRSLGLDPSNDKYVSKVDGLNYVLIEKFPRSVKKLLGGIDERELATNPSDSLEVVISNRKAERLIKKTDVAELIVSRYWFDGLEFVPVMDLFSHIASGLTVKVQRVGNEGHKQGYMPSKTWVTATGNGLELDCTFNIKRSRINREYDMPFDPPANYERRKSL